MHVLEAGAGVGSHSVADGLALGAAGHLFLYENDPLLKQVLHENLRANRIANATVMRRSLGRHVDARGESDHGAAGGGCA